MQAETHEPGVEREVPLRVERGDDRGALRVRRKPCPELLHDVRLGAPGDVLGRVVGRIALHEPALRTGVRILSFVLSAHGRHRVRRARDARLNETKQAFSFIGS